MRNALEETSEAEGKVRTMSGKPHTPRKLVKDKNITPKDASKRLKLEAESGQMCDVCFGNDDLPYDSDHFTKCGRCGKSVCMDCDGEMEYHPDWFKVCGECDTILENVSIHGAENAESFFAKDETIVDSQETKGITANTKQYKDYDYDIPKMIETIEEPVRNAVDTDDKWHQYMVLSRPVECFWQQWHWHMGTINTKIVISLKYQ